MFETKFVKKIKTYFRFSKCFVKNHAVCEIMWKNIVEPNMSQMTIKVQKSCNLHARLTKDRIIHTHTFIILNTHYR
jgi:hypothetical protein